MNILAPLMKPLGEAIFAAAVAWLKDPANRDDAEKVGNWLIDKVTDAIPGTWDDNLLDGLASRIAGLLKIPGVDQLASLLAKFGIR